MSHVSILNVNSQSMYVKIILDTGASASIINEKYVCKNNNYSKKKLSNMWSTMTGSFATSYETKVNLQLPALYHAAHISAQFHVTKQESAYDLIFWQDLLRESGIVLNFNKNTVKCNEMDKPMKPCSCTSKSHFAIQ